MPSGFCAACGFCREFYFCTISGMISLCNLDWTREGEHG
jgi:hypothetical protein